MGADFLGAMCPMEISRDEAKERLRKYDKEFLLSHLDDYFCQQFDEDDTTAYEQAIQWVDDCINITYDYYERGSRDTTVFNFRGVPILITGGLSWGDDPTDAFQPMGVVQSLELTVSATFLAEHMKEWRKEQEKA